VAGHSLFKIVQGGGGLEHSECLMTLRDRGLEHFECLMTPRDRGLEHSECSAASLVDSSFWIRGVRISGHGQTRPF